MSWRTNPYAFVKVEDVPREDEKIQPARFSEGARCPIPFAPPDPRIAAWWAKTDLPVDAEPLREAIGYRDNPRRAPARRPWWKFWAP